MIIDFHAHVFPDKLAIKTVRSLAAAANIQAYTDGTVRGLMESMDKSGVDVSVILPVVTKPDQFDTINQFAYYINTKFDGRLLSFGGIHPDCEDYKEKLNRIKERGLLGIKIHPDYQQVMIDDVRYMNIIEYADALNLVIITHAGVDVGLPEPVHCPPKKARKVLDTLKPKKMVLAHYGGWKQWEEVYEYLAGEDVYFDTAFTFDFIEQEQFMKILEKHGSEKILFATDSPWSDAGEGIRALRSMPMKPEQMDDILANNAKRLLKLE